MKKQSRKEVAFKASKEKKQKQKPYDDELAEDKENFVEKLEKGSGKYKGKLPLRNFNYGKIGNYAKKCPYLKREGRDDEEYHIKWGKVGNKKRFHMKSLYSKEDSDDDKYKLSFMGLHIINDSKN